MAGKRLLKSFALKSHISLQLNIPLHLFATFSSWFTNWLQEINFLTLSCEWQSGIFLQLQLSLDWIIHLSKLSQSTWESSLASVPLQTAAVPWRASAIRRSTAALAAQVCQHSNKERSVPLLTRKKRGINTASLCLPLIIYTMPEMFLLPLSLWKDHSRLGVLGFLCPRQGQTWSGLRKQ